MWVQASDLLDQAERMHRQFFRLATPGRGRLVWEPPVDIFENEQEWIVVVALPGVPSERIEILAEPGYLLVRADCPIPFAGVRRTMYRLEIPYGRFERRVPLPTVQVELKQREFRDGYLIMAFDKLQSA